MDEGKWEEEAATGRSRYSPRIRDGERRRGREGGRWHGVTSTLTRALSLRNKGDGRATTYGSSSGDGRSQFRMSWAGQVTVPLWS